jgi:Fur family transcriptional regulator, ferric uptake regulator
MTSDKHSHSGTVIHTERLTKGSKKVLEVLERLTDLSSAQDIHGQLRTEDPNGPGLTTVYRSLESLVSLGLVQAVDLGDGERRYELVKPGEHHHHLICDQCRSSIHLDQCLVEDLEHAVSNKYGFEIHSHVLEIFGLCPNCKQKRSGPKG